MNKIVDQETNTLTIDTAGTVFAITSQITDSSGATLTLSGERAGAKPERLDQGGVVKARRELRQQRSWIEYLSLYSLFIKTLR